MKLLPLFQMTLVQPERTIVGPLDGGESFVYGTPRGEVRGTRLTGQIRAVNHGLFRADRVNHPDMRGLIEVTSGAVVYFELRGYALPAPGGSPISVAASMTFRTADASYRWLNRVFGLAEAVFDSAESVTFQVWECQTEPAST